MEIVVCVCIKYICDFKWKGFGWFRYKGSIYCFLWIKKKIIKKIVDIVRWVCCFKLLNVLLLGDNFNMLFFYLGFCWLGLKLII